MKDYIENDSGVKIALDKSEIIRYAKKALKEKDRRLNIFGGSSLWCRALFVAFCDLYNCTSIQMFTKLFEIELYGCSSWSMIYIMLEKEFPNKKALLENE